MKMNLLFLTLISLMAHAENVSLYPVYQGGSAAASSTNFPSGMYGGMGIGAYPGAGGGMNGGAYTGTNTGSSSSGSLGFYDSSATSKYNIVRPSADCPLLTQSAKDDQDTFSDLQTYFNSFSQKAECAQDNMSAMSGKMTVSQLETLLNTNTETGAKCYSKNVSQISSRNMALYYVDKEMEISSMSPYYECSSTMLALKSAEKVTKDIIVKCITDKYQQIVELNTQYCKEVVSPAQTQENINKGLVELERILINSLSQKSSCAPSAQDAFKMTMNTFLKVKSLSVVGPWGMMAGFGADLIGNLLDKFFPSDSQKASNLLADILNENNFEQNACLYYNIQQKMYCSDIPFSVNVPQSGCNRIEVNSDLVKLMNQVKDLKTVSDTAQIGSTGATGISSFPNFNNPTGAASMGYPKEVDVSKIENKIEDITKYAKASEQDIRNRLKSLPKVQQSKELAKLNRMYQLLDQYQNFDLTNPETANSGQKALEELLPLLSGDSSQKINFDELILKTTPGVKFDSLKQAGISSAVESLLASNENSNQERVEKSRSMAKYNKYKNAMGEMAQSQFKTRLEKQFDEFKKQVQFVSSKDNGVVNDQVSEGILRNIVRHCTLMQEIYDPKIEGSIPRECQKLNCGNENRMNWFIPQKNQSNLTAFKKSFCEKNITYPKIEEKFIKELRDSNGAKICGKSVSDFFY